MPVQWGLAQPQDGGFDYLKSLQAIGQQQAQRQLMEQRGYAFDQQRQQDAARPLIAAKARAGDYVGARRDAALSGDTDFATAIGQVHEDDLAQIQQGINVIGNLHDQLKGLPQEQRARVAVPVLTQLGIPTEALGQFDWSDGALDGLYAQSKAGLAAVAARMKAAEPYTLAPGSRRYSGADIVAENPAEPKYQAVPEGGMLVRVDGGSATPVYGSPSPASGGSMPSQAPGERYQYGWTPRQRNGGDNSDAAVDSKIAGMAKALGIGPDDDIRGVDPMRIARALALSEGGAGSLADKNNNPGNLRNPRTLEYRKFADKNAGLQAASSQVRRNLARGQTSIRTMVEGLPVNGQQQGGAPNVIMGRPKSQQGSAPSGYRFNGDRLEPIPGGPADPTGPTNRNVQSNRKAEADFRKEFDGLPEVKTFKTARQQFNTLRDLAGKANPTAQDDIAIIFNYMKTLDPSSVVREGEFATAQNSAGVSDNIRNAYNKAINGTRLNPQQRKDIVRTAYRNYANYRDAYNTAAENYRGYARDNGINPDRVARTYTPDKPTPKGRGLGMGQSTQIGGFKVTRIN